jgi:hypothetical protein
MHCFGASDCRSVQSGFYLPGNSGRTVTEENMFSGKKDRFAGFFSDAGFLYP